MFTYFISYEIMFAFQGNREVSVPRVVWKEALVLDLHKPFYPQKHHRLLLQHPLLLIED